MMSLHAYLQECGILDTQAEADNSLRQAILARYGSLCRPDKLLSNDIEFGRFCEHLRAQWLVDVPDEMIRRALGRVYPDHQHSCPGPTAR